MCCWGRSRVVNTTYFTELLLLTTRNAGDKRKCGLCCLRLRPLTSEAVGLSLGSLSRFLSKQLIVNSFKKPSMLKENHFRVCKRLTCVSSLISGKQCATSSPLQTSSRTFSGASILFKETCYEHLKVFDGKSVVPRDAGRVKLCSRESRWRTCIANHLLSARLLSTSALAQANTHTTPGRNSTDKRKTNFDLKTTTARKPAAKNPTIGSRRTSNQKVETGSVSCYVIKKNYNL